jgi:hypothetical protein
VHVPPRRLTPISQLGALVIAVTSGAATRGDVRSTLETFKTRREEAARSALHGIAFEDQLGEVLAHQAQRVGDVL